MTFVYLFQNAIVLNWQDFLSHFQPLTPIEYYETGNKLEWVLEMNGQVWT
jgi:hypothetical protein